MKSLLPISLVICIIFSGCEKDIDFNLKQQEPLLVVDGRIETNEYPVIFLSKSLGYFETLSQQAILSSLVNNAEVFISVAGQEQKLKLYNQVIAPGISIPYYSSDLQLTNPLKGTAGNDYNLRIVQDGKSYSSTTRIPNFNASLDSAWVIRTPNDPDTNKRSLFLRITDPPGRGNYVRYFSKQNSGQFLPGENSVFDDQIIDGTTFDVQLEPGIDRNNPLPSDSNFFKRGDSISLKFCDIDKATYTFWNTWEFSYQSIGNPFAQPNKVIGNISNNALGSFCGYAVRYYSFVAQ